MDSRLDVENDAQELLDMNLEYTHSEFLMNNNLTRIINVIRHCRLKIGTPA